MKFETNVGSAEGKKHTWEEELDKELHKKKYKLVFKHQELDYIIAVLEEIHASDFSDVRNLREGFEGKLPAHSSLTDLIDRLNSAPEVESKK